MLPANWFVKYQCILPYTLGWREALILVPRGRAPFGQHQESRPLARSNDIPVLNGFVNTTDWVRNQSDLSDLNLSMRRVTGSPWIADFRCWTWPEVAILGADQKERGLWGREWEALWKQTAVKRLSMREKLRGVIASFNSKNPACGCDDGWVFLWVRSEIFFLLQWSSSAMIGRKKRNLWQELF